MDVIEAIKRRRSIRKFINKKIPRKKIFRLIELAQWAPSACNQQGWKFIVLNEKKIKEKIVEKAKSSPLILKAPTTILIIYEKNIATEENADLMSASAAIQNLLLAAENEGISSVWVSHVGKEEILKKILGIPKYYLIVSFVLLGYSNEKIIAPERKKPQEIISFNKFEFNRCGLPLSISPTEWNTKQIIEFRDKTIRQTSANANSFSYGTKKEFESEIKIVLNLLNNKKVVELLPYNGTHMVRLLKEKKFDEYKIIEMSRQPIIFINERIKADNLKQKITPIISNFPTLQINSNSYEMILCFQKLEALPDLKIISELNRIIKPNGKLIISFRNKESFFGVWLLAKRFTRKKEKAWEIFEPISYSKIKRILNKNKFEIKQEFGISPSPFERGKIIRDFTARFCKIIIMECIKT
ncbi:MAG: nitroreductase family protein [Candidatus Diapherotrites archaeon]